MGRVLKRAGWRRGSLRGVDEVLLGPARRAQRAQHAQPQLPSSRRRRLALSASSSTTSTWSSATARPRHPVEETVWAMHASSARAALYWGTSEWSAEAIQEAWDVPPSATTSTSQ